MAYEEKSKAAPKNHGLSMENRSKLSVTGVEDVESFDETEVVMQTAQGNLVVRGSGLHIGRIFLYLVELNVEGLISELLYEETPSSSGGFWSRLFG